jgi:hypothetical protein
MPIVLNNVRAVKQIEIAYREEQWTKRKIKESRHTLAAST